MELPCFFELYSPNFKGVHVHLCIFEYLPKTPRLKDILRMTWYPRIRDIIPRNPWIHIKRYNDGHLGGLDLPNIGFLADAWILEVLEY